MSEFVRQMEWAANYVLQNPARRCRCAGSCDYCREHNKQNRLLSPENVLRLVHLAKKESGS